MAFEVSLILSKIKHASHARFLSSTSNIPKWESAMLTPRDIKANMNSYIQLQTAAIFFSIEPLSKTGYWLGVCHGSFHLQGLTGGVKNASWERITKLKSLAHSGIRTRDIPLTKRARYHWATKANVNRVDKSSPSFYLCYFYKLTYSTCYM